MFELTIHEEVIFAVFYWTFAVVVFSRSWDDYDVSISHALAIALFFPIFGLIAAVVILYRLPVKSVRAIRADLQNRKLLRKFDKWLEEQETPNDQT